MTTTELTDAEWQLIEMLREQQEDSGHFLLVVEHRDGAWEFAMSHGGRSIRGVGATFDRAWEDDGPSGRREIG